MFPNYYSKSKSKYGNTKINYGNETFDSKKELNRYLELKLLERANELSNLQRQVEFVLIPNQYETIEKTLKNGKIKQEQKLIERKCEYIADFVYKNDKGETIVEDVKGYKNGQAYALFTIKRKLMLHIYGIKIIEV